MKSLQFICQSGIFLQRPSLHSPNPCLFGPSAFHVRWMSKQVEDWLFAISHNRALREKNLQRVSGISAVSVVNQ